MALDYSKLSDADLRAIAANDLSSISTETLRLIAGQEAPPPKPIAPSTERTFGEAIKDVPASLATGIGGLLQFPGQLVQLIPGLQGVGQALETPGKAVKEFGQDLKSAGLKAREALRSQAISDAEKEGILSEFATAITSTIKDPALITSFIAEQVPLLLGPAAAAKIAQKATAAGIAATTAGTAAREAAEAAAAKTATRAAIGTGTAMQSADVSSDAYQTAYQRAIEMGMTPERANAEALNAARIAAAGAGAVSLGATVGLGKLGGAAIERRLAGLPGAGRIKSGIGEATSETLEEAGGQLFSNIGVRTVDPNQSLTAGVGSAAAMGALGGGFFGTMLGKKPDAELAPGQRPGESLYDTAARLNREIKSLEDLARMGEPAPPRTEGLLNVRELVDLASKPADQGGGYAGVQQYLQTLNQLPASPERDQAVSAAKDILDRIAIEEYERQRPAELSYKIAATDLTRFGIKGTDPLYKAALGKDITNPADVQSIQDVIDAELNRKGIRQTQAARILSFKNALDLVLAETLPAGGLYAPPSVEPTTGERPGLAGVPGARAAAEGLGEPVPGRVVPTKPITDKPAGRKAKPAAPLIEEEITPQAAVETPAVEEPAGEKVVEEVAAPSVPTVPAKEAAAPAPVPVAEAVNLPKELAGAKPRYSYGSKQFQLTFDNDISKALYITAQATPSKRDADYRAWLLNQGFTPAQIDTEGKAVREQIKSIAKGADPKAGPIAVPAKPAPVKRSLRTAEPLTEQDVEELGVRRTAPAFKRIVGKTVEEARPELDAYRKLPDRYVSRETKAKIAAALGEKVEEAKPEVKAEAPKEEAPKEKTQREAILEKRTELIKELDKVLNKILAKYGLKDVKLNLEEGFADEGSYSAQIIKLALDLDNPVRVLRHEAIHALKDMGFFSDAQWNTLVKTAKDKWIQTYLKDVPHTDTQSRYDAYVELLGKEAKDKGLTGAGADKYIEDSIIEEAIADAFGAFDTEKAPPGMIAALLKRMRNLFKAVKEAFGIVGIDTAEDIFGKIEKGSLKPAIPVGKQESGKFNAWKATEADVKKAETYEEKNGIKPYLSEGRLDLPTKYSIKSNVEKYGQDPILGIPLNKDGTVTVYYHTVKPNVFKINSSKIIPAEGRDRIYLTNESSGAKVYGNRGNFDQELDGSVVLLNINPSLLQIDQEYEDGRKDFFVPLTQGDFFNKKMQAAAIQAPRTKAIVKEFSYKEHQDRIAKAVEEYNSLTGKEKQALLKKARAVLKKEHNIGTLMTENGKLEKTRMGDYGLLWDGKPIDSMGLGLAAAQQISEKLSTCPNSAICQGLCLGETSGGNFLYGGAAREDVEDIEKTAFRAGPRMVQYLKTEALIVHPEEFAIVLQSEIDTLKKWDNSPTYRKKNKETGKLETLEKEIYQSAVRLNVTSDFRPEMWSSLIEANPDVMFYDYTKMLGNTPIAPNHHLTYSSTGFGQKIDGEDVVFKTKSGRYDHNWPQVRNRLNAGYNVAMAFSSKSALPKTLVDEETGVTYNILDGDDYDARFLDEKSPLKQEGIGVIVGLRNKASTLKEKTASKETDGFFVDYDPKRDGDSVTVPDQTQFGAPAYKAPGKTIPIAKKSLRAREVPKDSAKAFFKAAEKLPRTEGIEAVEEAWSGGVADFGDRDAAQYLGQMPGYSEYASELETLAWEHLAGGLYNKDKTVNKEAVDRDGRFYVYRYGDLNLVDEINEGGYEGRFEAKSTTLSINFARAFANFAAFDEEAGVNRGWMRMAVKPESIIMIGSKSSEMELVVDLGNVESGTAEVIDETFQPADPQARFSLRSETPQFKFWFGQSKIVDKDGKPKVMYHGTGKDYTIIGTGRRQAKAIFVTDDPDFAQKFSIDTTVRAATEAAKGVGMSAEAYKRGVNRAINAIRKDYRSRPEGKEMIESIRKGFDQATPEAQGYLRLAFREELPAGPNILPLFVKAENPFDFANENQVKQVVKLALQKIDGSNFETIEGLVPVSKLMSNVSNGSWITIESNPVQEAIKDLGFDGFYVHEVGTRGFVKSLAVYSPTQIVSATGNVGAYRQRPITAEEAARFGMTEEQAADAQKRGDIRFSLRSKGQPVTRENVVASMLMEQSKQPFMNCQLCVQMATGVSKVRDLPKVKTAGIGDIYTFNETKDMASHYAIDVGDGDVAEIEAWGEEVRVVPLADVTSEYGEPSAIRRPPDTAYTDKKLSLRSPIGLYSELENKVEAVSSKAAPAGQWKAMIGAMTQKGVKPEEIEWSGVNDWLDLQTGKVTKDDLLEYLRANGVQVEEVVIGRPIKDTKVWSVYSDSGQRVASYFNEQDAQNRASEESDEYDSEYRVVEEEEDIRYGDETKYGQYTLPGGENYREVLLTLPSKVDYLLSIGASDNEVAAAARNYRSSHWDQPNVLAHIRLNDRTDANGNKVLFVEEIQSDWGQEGKKRGFGKVTRYEYEAIQDNGQLVRSFREKDEAEAFAKERGLRLKEIPFTVDTGIPVAPFVTKTEGWLNLALKRIMIMAAEGGYDKVAFVNGEQSAERYDLSKQISTLDYKDNGDGTFTLFAVPTNRARNTLAVDRSINKTVTVEQLPDMVGKEVAEKIVAGAGKPHPPTAVPPGYKTLSGLDLKVGGEGMKTFYDQIVPTALKKLLPKVGGGEMKTIDFSALGLGRFAVFDEDSGNLVWRGKTKKEAEEFLLSYTGDGFIKEGSKEYDTFGGHQPGFDVTPSMKEKVATTGLPKFSLRSAPTTPEFKRWFGDSKVVDADGKPLVVYHGTGFDFDVFEGARKGAEKAYFFAKSPELASDFALTSAGAYDGSANVMPVYLKMDNPLVIDYKGNVKWGNDRLMKQMLNQVWDGKYDGVIAQNVIDGSGEPTTIYAVIKPNQIKSATGNIGTYDATSPDIRRSLRSTLPASVVKTMDEIAPPRYEPNLAERMENAVSGDGFTRIRQYLLNRYEALAALDRRVAAQLKRTGGAKQFADSKAETAALFSDLSAGVLESVMGVHDGIGGAPIFRNGITTVSNYGGTVKGLMEIFRPLSEMRSPEAFNLFQTWAAVKRGQRLDIEGREDLVEPHHVKAMQDLQRSNPQMIKTFEAVQKDWLAYNNALVKYMKDTGVISPEMAKKWTEHGDYWPFYRLTAEEDIVGPKAFMSIGNVTPPKKLKGGENPLGDFFENVVRNSQSAIQAGMKNVAAQNATKQALMLGEVVRLKGREPGVNVYRVFENGKEVFYRASDPLFIEAIKALNMADIPFIGILAKPAAWLRNLVTKDPAFMLANMMRDSLSAWVTTGKNITPIYSTLRNFSQALAGQSSYINELYAAGLLGGYDYATGTKDAARVFEKTLRQKAGQKTTLERAATPVTSLWEALEKGTQASDAATRIEIYKKVLAETGNEAEALSQALEVMNFNRKGNSALIRVLTAAVPFLNARMQGLDVLYRSAIQPLFLGNASEEAKQRMKTFWMRGMLMISTSMMYWLLTHDDDEYKKQEQETRDDNWLIPSLGIRIPIPFEVGVLFKVLPERIMELNFGGDTTKDFTTSMKRQFLNTFAFNPMPQTVKPLYEIATNHSFFTQRPIIGMGMERVAERYQIGPSTSRTAQFLGEVSGEISSKLKEKDSFIISKMIGESIGLSPMKIDYLIKGYTGTIGTYISDLIDMIWDMNSEAPKASKRFEQMPVIKRFITDPEARGTITAYYKFKEEVDTAVRTANYLERSNNFEELSKYTVDNLNMLASRDYVNDIEKDMKDLREMRNQVVSGPYSADTKRDLLRGISAMESALTSNIQRIKQFGQK